MDQRKLPAQLTIVAILFFIGGVFSVIDVIISLMNSHINVNFGVLGLFIGPGLQRLSRGWRTCALVFIWIGLVVLPVMGALFLWSDGPLEFTVFGNKVGEVPTMFGALFAAVMFLFALWEYCVLTRADVRELFGLEPR